MDSVSQKSLFYALELAHVPFDYVYIEDDTTLKKLLKYEVLFYPHALILTKKRMELLTRYVEQGGNQYQDDEDNEQRTERIFDDLFQH